MRLPSHNMSYAGHSFLQFHHIFLSHSHQARSLLRLLLVLLRLGATVNSNWILFLTTSALWKCSHNQIYSVIDYGLKVKRRWPLASSLILNWCYSTWISPFLIVYRMTKPWWKCVLIICPSSAIVLQWFYLERAGFCESEILAALKLGNQGHCISMSEPPLISLPLILNHTHCPPTFPLVNIQGSTLELVLDTLL